MSAADHAILAFEQSWWQRRGPKSDAIRRELAMSASTYYRRLNALVDDPAADEVDPLLVRRLRRERADRRWMRHAGTRSNRSHS